MLFILSITSILRFFIFDVYFVPSESMEATIKTGEYVFTNKLAVGSRWFSKDKVTRLPGYSAVKRNDIIVFNFPEGDTVYLEYPTQNYYLNKKRGVNDKDNTYLNINSEKCFLPVQERIAYVKRCVGLPGDTIGITKGRVSINGIPEALSFKGKYSITGDLTQIKAQINKFGLQPSWCVNKKDSAMIVFAFPKEITLLKRKNPSFKIEREYWNGLMAKTQPCYPQKKNCWRYDTYEPLYIPAKDDTIALCAENLPIYKRLITVYEGNTLTITDRGVEINGMLKKEYVIKQNYYYMMGDNRYFSMDSRCWGFVPEDHVIGKARAILFSKNNNDEIRWNRIGTILK